MQTSADFGRRAFISPRVGRPAVRRRVRFGGRARSWSAASIVVTLDNCADRRSSEIGRRTIRASDLSTVVGKVSAYRGAHG